MLVELKRRLREISDLSAAGDILTWDQATYMPRGGADARARQCAALYGLAHEQAVAPALGKLLDALAPMARCCRPILTTPVLSVLRAATFKR